MLFAAVHESVHGTFRTWLVWLAMSASEWIVLQNSFLVPSLGF
jgi:hypothetical protein